MVSLFRLMVLLLKDERDLPSAPAGGCGRLYGLAGNWWFAAVSRISSVTPIPRLQPTSLVSIGSHGSAWALLSSSRMLGCDMMRSFQGRFGSAHQRRLDAGEEQPGDQQPDPDHEAEQADHVHGGELADAFGPQRAEVREPADGEESQDEEDHPERVRLADRGGKLGGDLRRRAEREVEAGQERHPEPEDELREALPDLRRSCLV